MISIIQDVIQTEGTSDCPCNTCQTGWGSISVSGCQDCYDTCVTYSDWKAKQENTKADKSKKPISEWTLIECYEYCESFRSKGSDIPCEDRTCELRNRGICKERWCHDWDLVEHIAFTPEEVDLAKALLHLFKDGYVNRNDDGVLLIDGHVADNQDAFPSINPGLAIRLSYIVDSMETR